MERERRAAPRYPIHLGLRYRLIHRRLTVDEGVARTVDISSSGILIHADRTFTRGAMLELVLDWPLKRESSQPLELRIKGQVVRSDEKGTAVRALKRTSYVFDIGPSRPETPGASGADCGDGG